MKKTFSIDELITPKPHHNTDELAKLEQELATLFDIENETRLHTRLMNIIHKYYKIILVTAFIVLVLAVFPTLTKVIYRSPKEIKYINDDVVTYNPVTKKWEYTIILEGNYESNKIIVSSKNYYIDTVDTTTVIKLLFDNYANIPNTVKIKYYDNTVQVQINKKISKVQNLYYNITGNTLIIVFDAQTKLVGINCEGGKIININEVVINNSYSYRYSMEIQVLSHTVIITAENLADPIVIPVAEQEHDSYQFKIDIPDKPLQVKSLTTKKLTINMYSPSRVRVKILTRSSSGTTVISCPFTVEVKGNTSILCNVTPTYTRTVLKDTLQVTILSDGFKTTKEIPVVILPVSKSKIEDVKILQTNTGYYIYIKLYVDINSKVLLTMNTPVTYNISKEVDVSKGKHIEFLIPINNEKVDKIQFIVKIIVDNYIVKEISYTQV